MYKAPGFLKKNDKVALVATAKNFDRTELATSIQLLKSWGLVVIEAEHLYEKYNQFAGTDEQRLQDLQWALDEKEIKAVFCARGGYGTARIIDGINWKKFTRSPKWVIGFSDVTTLHAQIQNARVQSIHGIMPLLFGMKGYETSVKKLKEILFGKSLKYKIPSHSLNRMGEVRAVLTGGNLSILCSLIGTASEQKFKNKILFLEDVGENLYRIDRMIGQLKRAGILSSLAGLVVGHFTNMEDNPIKFGKSAFEIIADATKDYTYPVLYGFPSGHEADNFPLVFGAEATLSVQKKSANLRW